MSDQDRPAAPLAPSEERQTVGADFILPALGIAFAAYYLRTIAGLPWEARVTGIFVCYGTFLLSAIFFLRALVQLAAGTARFSLEPLIAPREYNARRLGLVGLTIAFPLAMPTLGLTLTMLLFMLSALVLLGERSWKKVAAIALTVAAANYLLFIALLRTRFPVGPLEWLLAGGA